MDEQGTRPSDTPPGARAAQGTEGPQRSGQLPRASGVSRAQKVRLGVLVCVLAAVITALLWVRARQRLHERQRQEEIAAALAGLRRTLAELTANAEPSDLASKFAEAGALLDRVKELDPENREADRLAVPLNYASFFLLVCRTADVGPQGAAVTQQLGEESLVRALETFNTLGVKQIAAEIEEGTYGRAVQALDPYPLLQVDAVGTEMHAAGADYLHRCAVLWGLSRQIVQGAASQRDAALLLCRWLALHLAEQADALPAEPYLVIWRGYGTAPQLAWTYAELARQAGLRCHVAALSSGSAKECLVRVSPDGGDEILVNPRLGVPVVDPSTGEPLSLEALARRSEGYGAQPAASRQADSAGGPAPEAAEWNVALDPRACFPRFLVFSHLLSPLPDHPRVSFEGQSLPTGEPLLLWQFTVNALGQTGGAAYSADAEKAYRALRLVHGARLMQMQGLHRSAAAVYASLAAELGRRLSVAEVPEAAAVLSEAVELARFYGAVSEYDGGDSSAARQHLTAYLDEHPEGRWLPLAKALLSEALLETGDRAGAESLWKELPGSLKLYGTLRAKGLLPEVAGRRQAGGTPAGEGVSPPDAAQPAGAAQP